MPTRRRFLLAAAGLALTPALARCVADKQGPAVLKEAGPRRRDRLRLACIGTANRGWENIEALRGEQIVALCDVDWDYLKKAGFKFVDAKRHTDWNEVVEARRALDLDGIVVSTPDHSHFPIAAAALRCGLPVYCEKPLAHTLGEARELRMMARESGLSTQLGTQIHASSTYRQVVEAVRAGAVGRITAVDCWQTKSWGGGKLTPGAKAPPNLNWNLWLCKKPSVPYIEGIHPANWRRYWAYGSGTLGDMGCHIMDLPVWALGLAPTADMPGSGSKPLNIEVRTEGPPLDSVGTPEWLEVTWAIPGAAGEGKDPLVLRWFDGGRKSPFVQEIGAKDKQDYHGRFSVCFQGTEGAILANYDEMLVWPPARACEWYGRTMDEAMGITAPSGQPGGQPAAQRPVLTPMPSSPAALKVTPLDPSLGHHAEWVQAVKDRTPESPLCNFEYSGRLTELVLSGMEAFRAGRPSKVTIA